MPAHGLSIVKPTEGAAEEALKKHFYMNLEQTTHGSSYMGTIPAYDPKRSFAYEREDFLKRVWK